MRILHVVDLTDDAGLAPLACAAAMRRLPDRQALWTIGAPAGLLPEWFPPAARHFGAPLREPALGARALRTALGEARSAGPDPVSLVTCWSPGALAVVHRALAGRDVPVVGVFPSDPAPARSRLTARLLRAALARRAVLTLADSSAGRWRDAGASDVRVAPPDLAGALPFPSRDAARAALGLEPPDPALLLLSDPPSLADARRFGYLVGVLNVGDTHAVGLLHARSAQFRRAARFIRECGYKWRHVAWDGPLTTMLAAADVILCDARVPRTHPLMAPTDPQAIQTTAGPLAIALAAGTGVPVAAPRCPLTLELHAAGVPLHLAPDATGPALAGVLLPLLDRIGSTPSPTLPARAPGPDLLTVLRQLWLEQLDRPLPGFPLTLGSTLRPSPFEPGAAHSIIPTLTPASQP